MIRHSLLRSVSSALMCGVVAVSVTGLPLSHDTDHCADVAHLEHDHGGHGTVLLEQDEQLLSKTLSFSALTTVIALPIIQPATIIEPPAHRRSLEHPGRDPPAETRPRAPPILTG